MMQLMDRIPCFTVPQSSGGDDNKVNKIKTSLVTSMLKEISRALSPRITGWWVRCEWEGVTKRGSEETNKEAPLIVRAADEDALDY